MKFFTPAFKLGLIGLAFFSAQLAAQTSEEAHKIYTRLGVEFYLPASWKLVSPEELAALAAAPQHQQPASQQLTELLINTASREEKNNLVDNLVLSLSDYQVPSRPRKVKAACQALPQLLSASLNTQINLTSCQAKQIQQRPSLVLTYSTGINSATQVVHYLIQLTPQLSLNATLTYQHKNASSAAAFEAAMLKLEFKPQAVEKEEE